MDPARTDAYGESIPMNTTMQTSTPTSRSVARSRPLPFLGLIPEDSADGVRVASLAPNSPSAHAGLRPGDLILGLAGRMVRTVADYTKQLENLVADTRHVVYLQRGRGSMFLSVTPTTR